MMHSTNSNLNNMMTSDIKCFQHCKTNERYLCFDMPEKCPTCQFNLNANIKFKVPPFVLPKPLKLTDTRLKCLPPYSLLLQPTDCNYRKLAAEPDLSDLHIGVTNSDSDVFDFNQNGLNKNAHNWIDTPSIVIEIKSDSSSSSSSWSGTIINGIDNEDVTPSSIGDDFKWNMLLERHWKRRKELWNRCFYDEHRFNCLDFVINFLLEYGIFDLNQREMSTRVGYGFMGAHHLNNQQIAAGSSQRTNVMIAKNLLKQKISKEYIEPEFHKCLKYLNLIICLHENKYLLEKLDT